MTSLVRHELRVRRRAIVGWTVGLAFFGVVYMSFFPAMPDQILDLDVGSMDIYKSMGVKTMATFDGYMLSTVFNFLPLLVAVFGVVLGTGALAGEEDAGTVEHLAALPISRARLYFSKASALVLATLVVLLAVATAMVVVFLAMEPEFETSVTAADLFGVVLAHWLVAFVFLALGMALGAYLPSRGAANAAASGLVVLTFFGNNLAGLVSQLERLRPVLPFSHFARVAESINGSTPWDDVLVLAAMGLAALMLGAVGFWRRDLTVGAWTRLWRRHGPREAAQEALEPGGEMAGRRSGRAAAPLVAIAVAAFACIALSAIALWTSDDLRHRVRSAVGVDALEVSGTLAEGSAPVSPSAAGQVVAVNVGVGDLVAEGDVLLVLTGAAESPVRVAAQEVLERAWSALDEVTSGAPTVSLQDLRAALDRATDAAEAAEMEWDRARRADQNPSRAADLETLAGLAQTARRIAVARLALAEGHLSDADVRAVETAVAEAQAYLDGTGAPLALHSIRASRAGTVTEVLVTPTETITAGRAAVRISEPGTLEVAVRVSGDDAARITIGDEADVEVSGFDEPFQGEVIEVARTGSRAAGATGQDSDEEEHPFVVRIAVNASGSELRPGTNVDVRIPLD